MNSFCMYYTWDLPLRSSAKIVYMHVCVCGFNVEIVMVWMDWYLSKYKLFKNRTKKAFKMWLKPIVTCEHYLHWKGYSRVFRDSPFVCWFGCCFLPIFSYFVLDRVITLRLLSLLSSSQIQDAQTAHLLDCFGQ